MDPEQLEDLTFPINGIDVSMEYQLQPADSTRIGLNVRGYEPSTMRQRGGSRAGLAKYVPAQIPGGPFLIQHLNYIVDPQGDSLLTSGDTFGGTAPGIYILDPSSNNGGPGGGFGIVTGKVILSGGNVIGGISPLPFTTGLGARNPGRMILNGGSGIAPNRTIYTKQSTTTYTLMASATSAPDDGTIVTLTATIVKNMVGQSGRNVSISTNPPGRPGDGSSGLTDLTGTVTFQVSDTQAEAVSYSAFDNTISVAFPQTPTVQYGGIRFVQGNTGVFTSSTNPWTFTYNAPVTKGNLLLVGFIPHAVPDPHEAVTDNLGTFYSPLTAPANNFGPKVWWGIAPATGGCTVNVAVGGADVTLGAVLEYTGNSSVPIDGQSTQFDASAFPIYTPFIGDTGIVPVNNPNEMLVAFFADHYYPNLGTDVLTASSGMNAASVVIVEWASGGPSYLFFVEQIAGVSASTDASVTVSYPAPNTDGQIINLGFGVSLKPK
jgi:hypothetical protein